MTLDLTLKMTTTWVVETSVTNKTTLTWMITLNKFITYVTLSCPSVLQCPSSEASLKMADASIYIILQVCQ